MAEKRVDFDYNLVHQLTTVVRYRDTDGGSSNIVVDSSYVHDDLGRLVSLEHVWNMTTLAEYTWTYDTLNRVGEFESVDGTSAYSYDTTSQLTAADHTGSNLPADEAYSFDANGNRTESSLHGDDYVTGDNNQLLSDGIYNYTYDGEGNRATATRISSAPADDYKIEYQWDHRNRLIGLTFRDNNLDITKKIRYTYDVFDRRIAKEVDADADDTFETAERWVYDGAHIVLAFFDPDGEGTDPSSLATRNLHGPYVDQVLAQEHFDPLLEIGDTEASAGDVRWPLADNLGTIRDIAIWNASEAETEIANHLIYDSFGNIASQSDPSVGTHYAFTGREWDPDARMYYYRFRWYDPAVGRFVTEDPLGFQAGDTNTSRYVSNGTPNSTDPTGLAEQRGPYRIGILNRLHRRDHEIAGLLGSPEAAERYFEERAVSVGMANDIDGAISTVGAVADGFGSGLATGGKAVVNGTATAVVNTVTLGTNDGPVELIAVTAQDRANGYDTAVRISTVSGELLIGVVSGSAAAALANGGRVAQAVGGGLVLLDAAGNVVGVVRGTADALENGLNLENGTQIAGGLVGLGGNAAGLRGAGGAGGAVDDAPRRIVEAPTPGPHPSSPVGRPGAPLRNSPHQPVRNSPTTINGRNYSGHAVDQMQNRGLVPSVVDDTIRRGAQTAGRDGTIVYITEQAKVVLNAALDIIVTVMPK